VEEEEIQREKKEKENEGEKEGREVRTRPTPANDGAPNQKEVKLNGVVEETFTWRIGQE
jgi:hypothetical protein